MIASTWICWLKGHLWHYHNGTWSRHRLRSTTRARGAVAGASGAADGKKEVNVGLRNFVVGGRSHGDLDRRRASDRSDGRRKSDKSLATIHALRAT